MRGMGQLSLTEQKNLLQKEANREARDKQARIKNKYTALNLIEQVTGLVAAPTAGYISGKLDTRFDDGSGDGIKVMGMPVVPIAGALVAVGGMFVKGSVGAAMRGAGEACAYGGLFQWGFKKGSGS